MDLHVTLDRSAGRLSGRIAEELREAIRAGRLTTGTRLPSTRAFAADLGVSRGVVVTAYEQLVAEGFLLSRQGDGTRVAPCTTAPVPPEAGSEAQHRALRLAAATYSGPAELPGMDHDLRPGKPDFGSFPRGRWLALLREVLRDLPNGALDYPDPAGALALRAELAAYLGRVRAAVATRETVVITGGVAHALSLLPRILVEEGHRLLAVEDPLGLHQIPMLRATGIELVGVPVDEEGIDVAALARTGARAVLVTPAHQFPTGVVLSPRRRAALIEWAREIGGVIVEDDYDGEFRYDREPVGCLQGLAPELVVLAGSVSKSLSPALRLGWVVAPPWLAVRLCAARALIDLGSPVLDQHALARMIASGAYDRHLRSVRRRYRDRRDALVGALSVRLPRAHVRGVSAGLHLYVELPDGCDEGDDEGDIEGDIVTAAKRRGVAVEGVGPMRLRSSGPPALVIGYARVPVRRVADAVDRLAASVDQATEGRAAPDDGRTG